MAGHHQAHEAPHNSSAGERALMYYHIFRPAQYGQKHRHSRHSLWYSLTEQHRRNGCVFLYVLVWSQRARERLDFQQSKISAKQGEWRKHHWTASEMWYAAVSLWSSSGNMFHFCFTKRRLIASCLKLPLSAEVLPINLPCRKLKPAGSSCSEVTSLYSDKLRLNALCPSQTKSKAE